MLCTGRPRGVLYQAGDPADAAGHPDTVGVFRRHGLFTIDLFIVRLRRDGAGEEPLDTLDLDDLFVGQDIDGVVDEIIYAGKSFMPVPTKCRSPGRIAGSI